MCIDSIDTASCWETWFIMGVAYFLEQEGKVPTGKTTADR